MPFKYEIRDPVHGFIQLNEWEKELVNHPSFQRLRRIRQLAWTEMVYPGATHTRFSHSLGVMQVAIRLYAGLVARYSDILINEFRYTKDALRGRQQQLVRLAALLHDIGHAPFSHALEELMPECEDTKKPYVHEDYTIGILEHSMRDVIENHPFNKQNYGLTVQDITDLFKDPPKGENLLWRELITSQLDADRMDYMLRDSHHTGVAYGRYDLDRIAATIALVKLPDQSGYTIGIDEDGTHAAEGLLIARYMLFTQVYFHKTRVIYDYHLKELLAELLSRNRGKFPAPDTKKGVKEFLCWDDWRVYSALNADQSSEHEKILRERNHYRLLKETPEVPLPEHLEQMDTLSGLLESNGVDYARINAGKSWYKTDSGKEIYVKLGKAALSRGTVPLSEISYAIKGLLPIRQSRIYVPSQQRAQAQKLANKCG